MNKTGTSTGYPGAAAHAGDAACVAHHARGGESVGAGEGGDQSGGAFAGQQRPPGPGCTQHGGAVCPGSGGWTASTSGGLPASSRAGGEG
jgi:hypothetical protein